MSGFAGCADIIRAEGIVVEDDTRQGARQLVRLGLEQAVLEKAGQSVALARALDATDEGAGGRCYIVVEHLLGSVRQMSIAGNQTVLREECGSALLSSVANRLGEDGRGSNLAHDVLHVCVGSLEQSSAWRQDVGHVGRSNRVAVGKASVDGAARWVGGEAVVHGAVGLTVREAPTTVREASSPSPSGESVRTRRIET